MIIGKGMEEMAEKLCLGCMRLKKAGEVCEHCGFREGTQNASHQLPVGTVLDGKYLVGRALGQGGFGITYVGWDQYLDVPVAIKEYYPGSLVTRDHNRSCRVQCSMERSQAVYTDSKNRFLREAKALIRFDNVKEIVHFGGFFEENNTAYIVMEYIRGMDLQHYVASKGGKLTMEETLAILGPVMDALATVHEGGLIHRDISPDNIMLDEAGGIKLLDFGAVRDTGSADVEQDLTKSTEAILKQGFAPLEQYRSRGSLGPWTDVYALCATFYYCLTGEVPADSLARMMEEEDVDWDAVPGITERQRNALKKGMAVRARDRILSVKELQQELLGQGTENVRKKGKKTEAGKHSRSRGRKWIPVAAAAVVLVVGAGLYLAYGAGLLPGNNPAEAEESTDSQTLQQTSQPTQTEAEPETQPEAQREAQSQDALLSEETVEAETEPSPWSNNILRTDLLDALPITRAGIKTFTFLDTTAGAPKGCWDVSQAKDGSVLGWTDGWGNISIGAEGGILAPESCRGMFKNLTQLTSVSFQGNLHLDQTVSLVEMFYGCENLQSVDVQNMDVSSVKDMSRMFYKCQSLASLDLRSWDVSSVESFPQMFDSCFKLSSINMEGWNAASAVDMYEMFINCTSLKTVVLTDWKTPVLEDVRGMFAGCRSLSYVNVSCLDTSDISDMSDLFSGCESLTRLEVGDWDVSGVQAFSSTFSGCSRLRSLDVSDWDVSGVKKADGMFSGCSSLTTLDVSRWDTGKMVDMSYMFSNCSSISALDVSSWDTSCVTTMERMFEECASLPQLDVGGWDVSSVEDMSFMFCGCAKLLDLNMGNWDVSNVKNSSWFMEYGKKLGGIQPWELYFR